MKKNLFLLGCLAALASACNAPSAQTSAAAGTDGDWVDADLSTSKLKLPLIVKAPKGYTLNDTVSSSEVELNTETINYSVSDLGLMTPQQVVKGYLDEAKNSEGFTKVVLETPEGYIVQMGESYIPFRTVKAGAKNYEMRVIPLYALPSAEQAQTLYAIMGQAKAK